MAREKNLLSHIDLEPWESDDPAGSMDYLLDMLAKVRADRKAKIHDLQTDIQAIEKMIAGEKQPYDETEQQLNQAILHCLGLIEGEKHESELGKAQIIRPKPRVSYDIKGLETLRLSSDAVDRMIGHLRSEKPSKPYLKVKLK